MRQAIVQIIAQDIIGHQHTTLLRILVQVHNVAINLQGITIPAMVARATVVQMPSVPTRRQVNTGTATTGLRVPQVAPKLTVPMLNLHNLIIRATAVQAILVLGLVIPVGLYMALINAARESLVSVDILQVVI